APGTPIGVLGPGSGLGASGTVPTGSKWLPLTGEGGHATMAAVSDREAAVLEQMRQHYDHVSGERVLSGPGLVNIYNSLTAIDGVPNRGYTAAAITDPSNRDNDPLCRETIELFAGMLGIVAGNIALTLGARGGVYIAGGIVPRLGTVFLNMPFRERF